MAIQLQHLDNEATPTKSHKLNFHLLLFVIVASLSKRSKCIAVCLCIMNGYAEYIVCRRSCSGGTQADNRVPLYMFRCPSNVELYLVALELLIQ